MKNKFRIIILCCIFLLCAVNVKATTVDQTSSMYSDNMFNIDDMSDTGCYYSSKTDGTKSINRASSISNKIYVNNGDIISFMFQPQYYTTNFGCLFDKDGHYLESISNNNVTLSDSTLTNNSIVNILESDYITYTVKNTNAVYMQLNIYTQYKPFFMCVKSSVYPDIYKTYSIDEESEKIMVNNLKYIFNSCICIGDSLTEGNYGIGVGVKPKNYPDYLKKITNMNTVENAGVSGASPTMWWNIKNGKYNYKLYDVAIIFLGTNGTMTDTVEQDTSTTPYANTDTGNYCSIVKQIKTQNPNCKIFLVTRFANAGTLGNTNTNNAIRNIAAKYECQVIDLYTYNFYKNNSLWHPNDDVHFGKIGYLMLTNEIIKQMTEIIYNNQEVFNDNN